MIKDDSDSDDFKKFVKFLLRLVWLVYQIKKKNKVCPGPGKSQVTILDLP